MFSSVLSLLGFGSWFWLISLVAVVRLLYLRYHDSLHKYNGPFLASFTNLWRVYHAYSNRYGKPLINIHEKYGSVVRLGPNVLSFGHPQAIKDIYGPGKNFSKVKFHVPQGDVSRYYTVGAAVSHGEMVYSLFTSPDQIWHKNLRKSITPAFTMSSTVGYEETVDTVIDIFLKELDKRFTGNPSKDGAIDAYTWLLYFTFDVMGSLTYGARHGFIESGEDVHGIISYVVRFAIYGHFAGQMPIADSFLVKNPVLLWLERCGWFHGSTFPGATLAFERMRERQKFYESNELAIDSSHEDLLDKFFRAKKEHPGVVKDKEILGLNLSMIVAGSESSAISLTALLYYILRTPGCYSKLQEELDKHVSPQLSDMSYHKIQFSEARTLPYLNACIQEGFRVHPAISFSAERVVPPSGDTIDGHFVPGGTIVGCNPWVLHRDKATFGEDIDQFRPERWLGEPETVYRMSQTLFQFGAGNHICIGRNIAYLEIAKLIPSLMLNFEVSLDDPKKEWSHFSGGFVRQKDFNIRINRRVRANC